MFLCFMKHLDIKGYGEMKVQLRPLLIPQRNTERIYLDCLANLPRESVSVTNRLGSLSPEVRGWSARFGKKSLVCVGNLIKIRQPYKSQFSQYTDQDI
jgi:hypothetical protein